MGIEETSDLIKPIKRLAQCEGETGTDFEDRKTIPYQRRQRFNRLIICRVRLKDKIRHLLKRVAQRCSFRAIIEDHILIAKLNPGLNHQADSARKSLLKPDCSKSFAMYCNGFKCRLRLGHFKLADLFHCSAWYRNFRTNDIGWKFKPCFGSSFFSNLGETCRAFCSFCVAKRNRLSGTSHRSIKMNFGKACTNETINHDFSFAHGFTGGQVLPRIWPQMVTAQNEALSIKANICGYFFYKTAKICGCHARISAILINLIACRLNQHIRAHGLAFKKRCFNYKRMGRTNRCDATALALSKSCRKIF